MWMKNEISSAGNLIKIIEDSRNNALKKVNEELIRMYWNVGEYLSKEAENVAFGRFLYRFCCERNPKCISRNKGIYQAWII